MRQDLGQQTAYTGRAAEARFEAYQPSANIPICLSFPQKPLYFRHLFEAYQRRREFPAQYV